tara:strand:- start:111 stop:554 length:444 start_codon:yes stop_codon:yes gene_type:complete
MAKKNKFYKFVTLIKIISIIFLFNITFILQPNNVQAGVSNHNNNIENIERKLVKSYSSKFCNAKGIGLSTSVALKLTIEENSDPSFNPIFWPEIIKSGKKSFSTINKNDLSKLIANDIIENCGITISLSGQKGADYFYEEYLKDKLK